MIFPEEFRLFSVLEDNRNNAKIYLYIKSRCVYQGEIKDISPAQFEKLYNFLSELIQINNSENCFKVGIIEAQKLIKEFK